MSEITEARIAEIREQVKSYSREPWLRQDCIDLLAALDAARRDRDDIVSQIAAYRAGEAHFTQQRCMEAENRARAAEAERDELKEKLTDAQSYFTKANADVHRIMAETDRTWGSMPAAVEKIAALETERDRLKTALGNVVQGWEALDEGYHSPVTLERWLWDDMKPAIDAARAALAQEPS
jgi:chromosome segregation ATPase